MSTVFLISAASPNVMMCCELYSKIDVTRVEVTVSGAIRGEFGSAIARERRICEDVVAMALPRWKLRQL